MTKIDCPHNDIVGSAAAPRCVSISILDQHGLGITIAMPANALRQADSKFRALKTPSYDLQKNEVIKALKRYLKKPSDERGSRVAFLAYYAITTLIPNTPAVIATTISERGNARVTILVNTRKRILIGMVSETAPDAKTLSQILYAAEQTPMRGSFTPRSGDWSEV